MELADRPKVIAFGIGGTLLLLFSFYITQNGYLTRSLLWIGALGWIGNLLFIFIYLIVSFPVPIGTTPFILIAGFLYGWILGFLTVTIGSMIGAAVSFIVCRRMLASWVEQKLVQRQQMFVAIIRAIEKHAFKICFMVRMAPIPFGLQNAIFAMSRMNFKMYIIATGFGLLPEHLVIVYFGSTAKHLSEFLGGNHEPETPYERVFIYGQIFVSLALLAFLVRTGKKAFQDIVRDEEGGDLNRSVELEGHSPIIIPLEEDD